MTSIRGFENYIIFENGVVINTETGKEMKYTKNTGGYYKVGLSNNTKVKGYLVHRLIAEAYIPNSDNKPCIDHVNRIKTDNRIENLRWATHLENMQNKSDQINNTSGTTNVSYNKNYDKWYYRKMINGSSHCSPYYDTPEEAIEYKNSYEN
jgi:hypothetical protein